MSRFPASSTADSTSFPLCYSIDLLMGLSELRLLRNSPLTTVFHRRSDLEISQAFITLHRKHGANLRR
jgi:hypothetical protein